MKLEVAAVLVSITGHRPMLIIITSVLVLTLCQNLGWSGIFIRWCESNVGAYRTQGLGDLVFIASPLSLLTSVSVLRGTVVCYSESPVFQT